jgi:Protein of unknown function (DUF4065)
MSAQRGPTYQFQKPKGEQRLRELILYIASKCESDPYFGATKLNKILWLSDVTAYAQTGKPITGVEYMRVYNGPVPRRFLPVKEKMLDAKEIKERQQKIGGGTQNRIIALRDPNLSLFSAAEISQVDEIIGFCEGKSATDLSEMSHLCGWRMANFREGIPYEAIFLSEEGITDADKVRAKELIAEHGWIV